MSENLEDFFAVIICLKHLLKSQKTVLQYFTNADSIDNSDCCQKLEEVCESCKKWYRSILPQDHKLLQLPLQTFKCQLSSHENLYRLFKNGAFQTFQTTLTQEIAINARHITILENYVLDTPVSDFDDFSEELDDGCDESDAYGYDEMDEDELDELGKLGWLDIRRSEAVIS